MLAAWLSSGSGREVARAQGCGFDAFADHRLRIRPGQSILADGIQVAEMKKPAEGDLRVSGESILVHGREGSQGMRWEECLTTWGLMYSRVY